MKMLVLAAGAVLLSAPALAQSSTTTTTTITTEQTGKVRSYVMKEKPESVKITKEVSVGAELPNEVQLRTLPADVGVSEYSYTVVNGQTVLVEPRTRKIVKIIE
ncbi:DUF1236 domain-containing protein [Bosea sp. Leaf344]|uniref:DUF1236 domain-containing protein n=1 Tax=Bosea sp. Leaf344 TaxID=1736346 RepID=UPI0006F79CD9|nr:DUF1236 domain-containing protein [Bosea sp. Leaf344]